MEVNAKRQGKAAELYTEWKFLAVNPSNSTIMATYGQTDSWTLGDSIFVDRWLQTGLVDDSVRDSHIIYW